MNIHAIGSKVRRIRELYGKTQDEVAQQLNITSQAYGRIERGETALNTERLQEIAAVFDLTVQDILKFDDKKLFINHNNNNSPSGEQSSVNFNLTINEAPQDKTIELLEKIIDGLQKEICFLQQQNQDLLLLLKTKI